MTAESRFRQFDRAVARLAGRQHGVVARLQLLALGATRHVIEQRVRQGFLHRVHAGVYAVGHRTLTHEGRWMAAVLASGEGAVLSHQSAAGLWELAVDKGVPHTTTATASETRRGLRIHHCALQRDEVTVRNGIPVTTPARTLLDLATTSNRKDLERALRQAEFHRRADRNQLNLLLGRYPGKRGIARLRSVLSAVRPGEITRSDFEIAFLGFARRYRLPRPEMNYDAPWGEVDAAWPERKLALELDGRRAHDTDDAFVRDRARDREALLAGWRVVRATHLDHVLAQQLHGLTSASGQRSRHSRSGVAPSGLRSA